MELQGKIINFLGDSITEGMGIFELEHRYDYLLMRKYDLKAVNNYGSSGTRLARQSTALNDPGADLNFCWRAEGMADDADIITVLGGVNDYQHGDAPFGSLSDTEPTTFCGAVEHLMTLLETRYPKAKTVFMTPLPMKGCSLPSTDERKLPDCKPQQAYAEVIQEKAKAHGIPVLDLFAMSGIDPDSEADRAQYMPDGVHPNAAGHQRLAELLGSFLESL